MAYSLEAVLVVPLSLIAWAGLLRLAVPAYQKVEQSGYQQLSASLYALENQHLYRTCQITRTGDDLTALQVSPQSVLELCSLIQDGRRLVAQILRSGSNGVAVQSSGGLAAETFPFQTCGVP